jgi:hypothetical protein
MCKVSSPHSSGPAASAARRRRAAVRLGRPGWTASESLRLPGGSSVFKGRASRAGRPPEHGEADPQHSCHEACGHACDASQWGSRGLLPDRRRHFKFARCQYRTRTPGRLPRDASQLGNPRAGAALLRLHHSQQSYQRPPGPAGTRRHWPSPRRDAAAGPGVRESPSRRGRG